MTLTKHTLFQIPYYKIKIEDWKNKKERLLSLLKLYPEHKIDMQQFYTNRQSKRDGLLNSFNTILNNELQSFVQIIKKDVVLEDVWSVSYKKGDEHLVHNHGTLGFAGVLYLEFDKENPYTFYVQPWNSHFDDRTIYHPVNVDEGDIIIVPKFVQHFSQSNNSKKIKRIISWDMKILNA